MEIPILLTFFKAILICGYQYCLTKLKISSTLTPSMKLSHILFDVDNTLYNASNGLFDEMARRMILFLARYFSISEEEARALRTTYGARYGTTLGGLVIEGGLADPEVYIREVHPENVEDYIQKDSALRPMLVSLPYPKSIFTNSPKEHALRILEHLEIADCFEEVFDIRFCHFIGKPVRDSYERVLVKLGKRPQEVLLVDDIPKYLENYAALGGPVLLVKEDGIPASPYPCIRDVKELPHYLASIKD
jgi:putative hydrolase of the HAD superfamily